MTLFTGIWDDINHEAEAIVVSDISYNPNSLSNLIYEIIDNRNKRREVIRRSNHKGLHSEINEIKHHRDQINSDENISLLAEGLFKKDEIGSITSIDKVFLNSYYRRLLRAKLEQDYIGKDLVPGLVITDYTNFETDAALVNTLRILRTICKFLGIRSTIDPDVFPVDKLSISSFWSSVSNNFIKLFGENRIFPIEEENSFTDINMQQEHGIFIKHQVLRLLNLIFHTWSGSTLVVDNNNIRIVPATYVIRLIPKLRH